MRVLRVVWNLLFVNFWWKLLSLCMAVALWAFVASEPELSTNVSAQLEYKNLPDDLEIASLPMTSVLLELRGSSGVLRGIGDGAIRPAVILDMSNVQSGERTFTIGDGNVKLPRGVRLLRAQPSQARFKFERRLMRRVPVVVRFTGEGAHGYAIASEHVEPKELMVVGPASEVSSLNSVGTDPVDVSGVVGSSEFRTNAYVTNPLVRFQSSPQVRVMVTMRKQ